MNSIDLKDLDGNGLRKDGKPVYCPECGYVCLLSRRYEEPRAGKVTSFLVLLCGAPYGRDGTVCSWFKRIRGHEQTHNCYH